MAILIREALRGVVLAALAGLAASGQAYAGDGTQASGHGFADVNGTRLYYEVRGKGPALVLIHGGQQDSRIWDDQFDVYAKAFRVVRYDARGFGGSASPTEPFWDADDLVALMDYLGIEKAHLVGLSLGGRIAVRCALRYPQRVLSLVVSGPGLDGYPIPVRKEDMESMQAIEAAAKSGDLAKASNLWLQNPLMVPAMENPRVAARLRHMAAENTHVWAKDRPEKMDMSTPKRLAEIKVPTLVIIGDRDAPMIKACADKIAADVPGAKKIVIHGAGHMANMERPEEFNELVLRFLKKR